MSNNIQDNEQFFLKNKTMIKVPGYVFKYSWEGICVYYNVFNQNVVYGKSLLDRLMKIYKEFTTTQEVRKIFGDEELPIIKSMFDNLLQAGFLQEYSENGEESVDDKVFHRSGKEKLELIPVPVLLRFLVTYNCNLNCYYCQIENNIDEGCNHPIGESAIERALKIFKISGSDNETKTISVSGGEPLLYPDTVRAIVLKTRDMFGDENKCRIVLQTNGTLVDKVMADFIYETNTLPIVSLDGPAYIHDRMRKYHSGQGTFLDAIQGYYLLKNAGCDVALSVTVGPHNVSELPDILKYFIHELEPISVGLNYPHFPSCSKEIPFEIDMTLYAKKLYDCFKVLREVGIYDEQTLRHVEPFVEGIRKTKGCSAQGKAINVDCRENTGPCKTLLASRDICMPLWNWKYFPSQIFMDFAKRTPFKLKQCSRCPAINICGGECTYNSFVKSHNLHSIDEIVCAYVRKMLILILKDLYHVIGKPLLSGERHYYIPSYFDKKKLYGNICIDYANLSLRSSVAHQLW